MAGKPIRLGKAAGELNVGIPTIVEFLGSKGIVIDPTPTSRLEQEHYDILCREFAADQSMKEQSKAALRREKRESLSLKDKPQEEPNTAPVVEDEDEEDINLEEIKRQVLTDAPAKAPAPKVEETPAAAEATENKVNVVGKIDLDSINQRTRPDKKKDKIAEAQPAATPSAPEPDAPAPTPAPAEETKA